MVREAQKRKKKYEANVDGDNVKAHTDRLKPLMVESEAQYFADIADMERRVKRLVEDGGVSTLSVRDYLNFAREIFRVTRTFEGVTRDAEAQIYVDKWTTRGLNSTLLCKIANLMGCDPTPSPAPSGEVDVTDRENRELGRTTVKNFPSEYPLPASQVSDLKDVSVQNFPEIYNIRELDPNIDNVKCSGDSAVLRNAESGALMVQGSQNGIEVDFRDIRTLTTSDNVLAVIKALSFDNTDGIPNVANMVADFQNLAIHLRVFPYMFNGSAWDGLRGTIASGLLVNVSNLLNPHPITQTTRTNLKTMNEREDLLIYSKNVVLAGAGDDPLLSAVVGQKHKVYAFGYESDADAIVGLRFGTGSVFGRRITKGIYGQTLTHPLVSAVNTALNFRGEGAVNAYVWVQYITEA